ncbi:putative YD repeat-containing protein [Tenacibaculum sp. 190524A02b]|uniref:RHS repeat domain-containing protein n=1 Tax=Tenacibaculum vairaonense TaxID=3137860 RepID=UPI0032B2154F
MKRVLLSIFTMLIYVVVYGQEAPKTPNFSPLTPEAASLGKYGSYPVNYNTGLTNIAIPLYEIKVDEVSLPITLSYHHSGIKVDDIASNVGLGWTLQTGGVINTQVINGEDLYYDIKDVYTPSQIEAIPGVYDAANDILIPSSKGFTNNRHDIYSYNFLNYSGQFVLHNRSEGKSLNEDNLKIKRIPNGFEITAPNGTIYLFSIRESITTTTHPGPTIRTLEGSSIYLSKIITAKKNEITFEYSENRTNDNRISSHSHSLESTIPNLYQYTGNNYSYSNLIHDEQLLKTIKFNQGKIVFTHSNRLDAINGSKKIDKFDIYNLTTTDNYTLTKQVVFDNDSYFDRPVQLNTLNLGRNVSVFDSSRNIKSLKLENVLFKNKNNVIEKMYKFKYNATKLPARETTGQDIYGYYNGKNDNKDLIEKKTTQYFQNNLGITITNANHIGEANRSVDSNFSQAAMLEEIVYPTGGKTKFVYENNYILNEEDKYASQPAPAINVMAIGKKIGNIPNVSVHSDEKIFTVTEEVDNNKPQFIDVFFTNITGGTTLPSVKFYDITNGTSNLLYGYTHLVPTSCYSNRFITNLKKGHTYKLSVNIGPSVISNGTCFINNTAYVSANLNYSTRSLITDITKIEPSLGPGLRIKEIISYDSELENNVLGKKIFDYGKVKYGKNKIGIASLLKHKPQYYSLTTRVEGSETKPTFLVNQMAIVMNQFQDINPNGNLIEYDYIKERLIGSDNNNGFTEYIYRLSIPEAYERNAHAYNTFPKIIYPLWKGARLINKSIYKENQITPIYQETYEYQEHFIETFLNLEVRQIVIGFLNSLTEHFEYFNYENTRGKQLLKKKIVTENNGSRTISQETNYKYNSNLLVSETTTTTSKGDVLKSKIYYANDLNDTKLINEHRITEPLETIQFNKGVQISRQKTEYSDQHNPSNLYLPSVIKTSKGDQDLENRILYISYDTKGNPTEVSKQDGTSITYLWGYNYTQPIAKIEGATYAQVMAALGKNSDHDLSYLQSYTESQLQTEMAKVRTGLHNALVTSFTYKPLIGVSTMTDARGRVTSYHYDAFNRLHLVKDAEGNILKENTYNYKNK